MRGERDQIRCRWLWRDALEHCVESLWAVGQVSKFRTVLDAQPDPFLFGNMSILPKICFIEFERLLHMVANIQGWVVDGTDGNQTGLEILGARDKFPEIGDVLFLLALVRLQLVGDKPCQGVQTDMILLQSGAQHLKIRCRHLFDVKVHTTVAKQFDVSNLIPPQKFDDVAGQIAEIAQFHFYDHTFPLRYKAQKGTKRSAANTAIKNLLNSVYTSDMV